MHGMGTLLAPCELMRLTFYGFSRLEESAEFGFGDKASLSGLIVKNVGPRCDRSVVWSLGVGSPGFAVEGPLGSVFHFYKSVVLFHDEHLFFLRRKGRSCDWWVVGGDLGYAISDLGSRIADLGS